MFRALLVSPSAKLFLRRVCGVAQRRFQAVSQTQLAGTTLHFKVRVVEPQLIALQTKLRA